MAKKSNSVHEEVLLRIPTDRETKQLVSDTIDYMRAALARAEKYKQFDGIAQAIHSYAFMLGYLNGVRAMSPGNAAQEFPELKKAGDLVWDCVRLLDERNRTKS